MMERNADFAEGENMKKKFLAILLACIMAAGLAVSPVGTETVWADESFITIGEMTYRVDGDTVAVYRGGGTGEVTIPESVDGKTVTGIDSGAFSECRGITGINIPSGVTSIGKKAFEWCTALESINIPPGVTNIGEQAFYACVHLRSIELPSGLKSIGRSTFCGIGVTSINIPSGVKSIGLRAFSKCSKLTSVSVPSSVKSIGSGAFSQCPNLTSINISSGVESISAAAFLQCEKLKDVSIPSSVKSIGNQAFQSCTNLKSISIPSGVKRIYFSTFSGCTKLKDIYYGGSKEQWNKIRIDHDNDCLKSAKIHYNSTGKDSKSEQTITAKDITKTYGENPFKLNAKSSVGAALTYAVSNKNVASVDKNGKVTIKGCGITNITITAKKKGDYSQAKKTIKLTVKPKKMALSSVKSTKKSTAAVKWKQDKKASGYIIQCATDSKFKNGKVQMTISKNKTVSATVKKLKAGKKYYVRVCAYAKSGKTKVQGDWSKVKTVKVKK